MRTQEQARAARAWATLTARFQDAAGWPDNPDAVAYLGALKSTPARIHTSGLGQAVAFLRSRQSDEMARAAAKDIGTLTLERLGREGNDLIEELRRGDIYFFMQATAEATAVVGWLTRYLEGAGVRRMDDQAAAGEEEQADE